MTFTEGRPSGRSQDLMCVFQDMNCSLDGVPKSHKEMNPWLQQANATTYLALAFIKFCKCNA
jgi:hypothetical protein